MLLPGIIFCIRKKFLYLHELTVGFESDIVKNVAQTRLMYINLFKEQKQQYKRVKFKNRPISGLCEFEQSGLPPNQRNQ